MSMPSPSPSPGTVVRQKRYCRTCGEPMAGHKKSACRPRVSPESKFTPAARTPGPDESLFGSYSDTSTHTTIDFTRPYVDTYDVDDKHSIVPETLGSSQTHSRIGRRPDSPTSNTSSQSFLHRIRDISPIAAIYDSRDLSSSDMRRVKQSSHGLHTANLYTPSFKEWTVLSEDRGLVDEIAARAKEGSVLPGSLANKTSYEVLEGPKIVTSFQLVLSAALAAFMMWFFLAWFDIRWFVETVERSGCQ